MAALAVRRLPRGIAIALALLACLAFVNALEGDFLYDDFPYVADNPQVQQPTAHGLLLEPLSGRPELGLYRPLPVATYALQAQGRGREAPTWAFHAFNVACHAGVTLLVALLALRLGFDATAAAIAGGLFAVHSCHLEAVDWIVGRAELLAALFGFGFLVVALKPPEETRGRDRWFAALLLALAALSKESAFALPVVLVVIEAALGRWRGGIGAGALRRHWPWVVVLALVTALRFAALGRFAPDPELAPFADMPWTLRPLIAAQLLGQYFTRALLPLPPRIFFHQLEFERFAPWALAGLVAWAAALGVAHARRHVALRAALLAFPFALATVLNLRPIQETFAERFLYLPSAFALLLPAALLAALVRRERERRGRVGLSLVAPAAAVAGLLGATMTWNPIFDDAVSLWRHNIAQSPQLPFPHYQLGYFLNERKVYTPRDAETPGAIEEFERALALNDEIRARGFDGMPPDQRIAAHRMLGAIHLSKLPAGRRDPRRALQELEKALAIGDQFTSRLIDAEFVRAALLFASLRVLDVGVTPTDARRVLEGARTRRMDADLRQAVTAELALIQP